MASSDGLSNERKPAVFWDRDGTLIEDRGHLSDPSEVVFFADTIPALRRLDGKYVFFIVTNQPGVGQGLLGMEQVDRVNRHVISRLADEGLKFLDVYVCPHRRDDDCACIKPKPFFLHKAAADHSIDLGRSFVVGDHPHDVELARRAGAQGIYVCTGHGQKHLAELPDGEIVVRDIAAAVEWILHTE